MSPCGGEVGNGSMCGLFLDTCALDLAPTENTQQHQTHSKADKLKGVPTSPLYMCVYNIGWVNVLSSFPKDGVNNINIDVRILHVHTHCVHMDALYSV